MKKLGLLLIAVIFTTSLQAQSKAAEDFINKYKEDRDASHVTLEGNIFQLIANIAEFAEDEDAETMGRIAKGIKSMNILKLDTYKAGIDMKEIDALHASIKGEGYEEMMSARDGREHIRFLAKTNDSQINNMLIMIKDGDDEFALINLDGVLEMKDLAYLAENHRKWSK